MADFLPIDRYLPDKLIVFEHRHIKHGACAREIEEGRPRGVACISRVSPNVFDLNYLFRRRYASKCGGGI